MCRSCGKAVLWMVKSLGLVLRRSVIFLGVVSKSGFVPEFIRAVSPFYCTAKVVIFNPLWRKFYPQYTALITKTTNLNTLLVINYAETAQ